MTVKGRLPSLLMSIPERRYSVGACSIHWDRSREVAGIGPQGGVILCRPATEVSLLDIGEAIEGDEVVGDCLLGNAFCADLDSCPTRDFWKETGAAIRAELKRLTLASVIEFSREHTVGMKTTTV